MDNLVEPLRRRYRSYSDAGIYETEERSPSVPPFEFASGSEERIDRTWLEHGRKNSSKLRRHSDWTKDNALGASDSELARVRSAVTSYSTSFLHCHGSLRGSERFLHVPTSKDMKSKVKNAKLKAQRNLSLSTPAMPPSRSLTPDIEEKFLPHRNQSRNKKFHRLFKQVPTEEKVVNYFACALLADILLQGHLYITENYFGFYSNVFGHVTKILIPVNTVVKITKERTAKIIPNAVGVETERNKHVFGSLLSRETTFKLMYRVWAKFANADSCTHDDSETENLSPDIEVGDRCDDDEEEEDEEDEEDDSPSGGHSGGRSSSDSAAPSCDSAVEQSCPPSPSKTSMASSKTKDSIGTPDDVGPGFKEYQPQGIKTCFQKVYEIVPVDRVHGSARDLASKLYSLPKSTFLLLLATIILVALFLSAAVLIYRLNTLHHRIVSLDSWNSAIDQTDFRGQIFQEVFKWQRQLHDNCVSDMQETLSIRIQQLAEVRRSLQTLLLMLVPDLPRPTNVNNKHSEKNS